MTTHASIEAGCSQCSKILAALQSADGGRISTLKLHQISGSLAVHSRINDLRNQGHKISNERKTVDGKIHSFYRLIPTEAAA